MKMLLKLQTFLFAAMCLIACGEDEYVYPDLITEITCLKTDANGFGVQIVTDEGASWELREGNRPAKLSPDSIYRTLCRFEPINSQEATLYAIQSVIAPIPEPADNFSSIQTDPVSIQSIWRSGDYLNMILQVKMKDQSHSFAFIEDGLEMNNDGKQTLTLTLYHDQNEDTEAYYEKTYLSVPLWHYQNKLNKGDTIVFQLNTYEEGVTYRTFTY